VIKHVDIIVESEHKSVALYANRKNYVIVVEDKNYIKTITFVNVDQVLLYINEKIDKTKEDIFKVFREELLITYYNNTILLNDAISSIFKTTKYYGRQEEF